MKKLLIFLLAALSLTAVAQQKKVAVYLTGEQNTISKVLGDELVKAFAKSGKYAAIERTKYFLAELEKEHEYQRSGAVDDKEIARLGIQFGVNYVCVAEMSDFFDEKYISSRLIDVKTAEVVNLHNVHGLLNSPDACIRMASEIATNLSKGSFAEQAKEEAILREEAERKKAESERKAKLRAQGWVDLGLPSGNLWKDKNEQLEYTYYQAVENFSTSLPTKEQWEELVNSCTWIQEETGFKVVGANGESIFLTGKFMLFGQDTKAYWGDYWSSTPERTGWSYRFYFYCDNKKYIGLASSDIKKSIRLVRHP